MEGGVGKNYLATPSELHAERSVAEQGQESQREQLNASLKARADAQWQRELELQTAQQASALASVDLAKGTCVHLVSGSVAMLQA